MRRWFLILALSAAASVAALAWAHMRREAGGDLVLYNHSPSLPRGLYVRTDALAARDAIVTVHAADVAPDEARLRGFDDPGDRFLKRVAAASGDEVCADGATIRINEVAIAQRRSHDSTGRPLPAWTGCRTLGADEFFLLGDTEDSFDGRYWGIVSRRQIEGVWRPLVS